jgi:cell division initiation protein
MFTPQQIEEQTFSKAVFGGYDMQQVDDFLEPLTEDYIALYKENSVLKSKMKVLVNKLEEYRAQEADLRSRVANAQATCDQMIAEAQKKCAAMTADAEVTAKTATVQQTLAEEEERVNCAKQTALNFIDVIEHDVKGHLELLETLKSRDMSMETKYVPQPAREKPYDWKRDEKQAAAPAAPAKPAAPAAAPAEASESASDIASEISENLEKLVGPEEAEPAAEAQKPAGKPVKPSHPDSATIKFNDLKFGRNYDPTSGN